MQQTKYTRNALLQRRASSAEPNFSTIHRLHVLEILDTSHCFLNNRHGADCLENHFIFEQQQIALTAKLVHELARLHLGLRRHRDRPPPCLYCKPCTPAIKSGCAALSRKLPSILLTNANHLTNKIGLLNGLLDDSKVNIAFITETWFNEANSTVMKCRLNNDYYALSATRDDRGENKDGGGALILVARSYASACLPIQPSYPAAPSWFPRSKYATAPPLAIDLKIAKLKVNQLSRGYSSVITACAYIAEFSNDKTRQEAAIYQVAHAIIAASKCSSIGIRPLIIVAGDFNGANTCYLCSVLKLHKISSKATHRKGGSLDLVFTNAPKCYRARLWKPLGKSDHKIVLCYAEQPDYKSLLPKPSTRLVRSGLVGDTAHFLRNTDWSPFICSASLYPQQTADEFYTFIKAAEDFCQPLKPLKTRVDQPWMTAQIQQHIAQRRALFRAGKRDEYKMLSEAVEHEIYLRKYNYTKRQFTVTNPDYWNLVNDYRELKQVANQDPALAEALNEGFVSGWSGVAQPDLTAYTSLVCPPPFTPLFTAANVNASLRELNTSSPGPDGISAMLLKSARLELCDPISQMFNAWLSIGFVPSQWRAASITPIAKVDHPTSWSDYRPISLTSNLCKVFEKILVKFIVSHTSAIWTNNNQHGFLPGRSTLDASIRVLFDLEGAHDRKIQWLAIFFDFAKAFDLVPHDLLLEKLAAVLPPWLVRWIACYLSDRTQRVRVGDFSTEWKKVEAGVIQGSVLGPVLFLIFIADINDFMPAGVSFEKYADDIIAYIIGEQASLELPQRVAEAVEKWCSVNRMRLNASKCKVMHSKPNADFQPPMIKLANLPLESVEVYKYLGFYINPSFNSEIQWNKIEPSISKNLHLLKQLHSLGLNESILAAVFKSLVLSLLRYSSTILVACSAGIKSDMQVLQNKLLRTIGIKHDLALSKYGIQDVNDYITSVSLKQVTGILTTDGRKPRDHPLAMGLLSKRVAHSKFPFTIPRSHNDKFEQNAVILTLVHMRDNVYGTGRANHPPQPPPAPPAPPAAAKGPLCPNPACKQPTRPWSRLDLHLPSCLKKNPPPPSTEI